MLWDVPKPLELYTPLKECSMQPTFPSLLLIVLWFSAVAAAQEATGSAADYSLAPIVWNGPGTTLEALEGKTVLVLSYVTWCPKCDAWAPEMFRQVKEAAADKPVAILAISTETPEVSGPVYSARRGLVGPNILHGHDPTLNKRFGLPSLFNFALFDPSGKLIEKGNAGSYYKRADGQEYVPSAQLKKHAGSGKFEAIDPAMPAEVKTLLWPLEMGIPITDRQLNRVKRLLTPEQQSQLDEAIARMLDRQLEVVRNLAAGEVPDKLQALEQAGELATSFRSTEQGQAAREIASELARDRELKREQIARTTYQKTMALVEKAPARRQQLLESFARRYDGTWYAQLALQAAAQPEMSEAAVETASQAVE